MSRRCRDRDDAIYWHRTGAWCWHKRTDATARVTERYRVDGEFEWGWIIVESLGAKQYGICKTEAGARAAVRRALDKLPAIQKVDSK